MAWKSRLKGIFIYSFPVPWSDNFFSNSIIWVSKPSIFAIMTWTLFSSGGGNDCERDVDGGDVGGIGGERDFLV
jgi:hypothetical protein